MNELEQMEEFGDFEDFESELEDLGEFEDFESMEAMADMEGMDGEYMLEAEGESDYEAGDIAEMEALAEAALSAESEAEADAFLGAIASLASTLLPKAISIGKKVLPGLIKGARRLFRKARRSPAGRTIARTAPAIIRHTVRRTLHRASRGQPISPTIVMRDLAAQTARMMRDPRLRHLAIRRHHHWVRRARPTPYYSGYRTKQYPHWATRRHSAPWYRAY